MQLNMQGREGLFLLKLVYDEELAKFRPGLQLHLDVIDDFHHRTDADWLDTCTYKDNETLLRMYPDRKRFCSYFVPLGRNPVDRTAARAFMVVRPLHKRALRGHRGPPERPLDEAQRSKTADGGAEDV